MKESWLRMLSVFLSIPCGMSLAQVEPRITRGPYLQAVLDTSAQVIWVTDLPSRGVVHWGEEEGPFLGRATTAADTIHGVRMSDLAPGKVYRYQVFDQDRLLESHRFRTSPPPRKGSIRVAAIGDSGTGRDAQHAVAALIESQAPDLLLHTGDLDYLGNPDRSVFGPYRKILAGACFYPVRGNHDKFFEWTAFFFPPRENPERTGTYYSFDWGSAHFVALDTELGFNEGSLQMEWLVADLKASRDRGSAAWIILYFHEPIFTVGAYFLDSDLLNRRRLITPIAERFGVDLVLNGHDHNYQRSHPVRGEMQGGQRVEVVRDGWQSPRFVSPRGTMYLVTGGGGQILYSEVPDSDHRFTERFRFAHHAVVLDIAPTHLSVRVLTPEGVSLDEFLIVKEEPRPELKFLRGDADLDGTMDITDPINLLLHLFSGEPLLCPAAADGDGSGLPLDIADPIHLLNFLFMGGPSPPWPFPLCAAASGADDSWCIQPGC